MRSLLISALALAAGGPALAQSDLSEPPMGGQMEGLRPAERETFAQMQARMTQIFNRLDANDDGVVDEGEAANARGGRMLGRLDADGDGRVTREEFTVGLDAQFKAQDKNGDGVVTADERPQRRR